MKTILLLFGLAGCAWGQPRAVTCPVGLACQETVIWSVNSGEITYRYCDSSSSACVFIKPNNEIELHGMNAEQAILVMHRAVLIDLESHRQSVVDREAQWQALDAAYQGSLNAGDKVIAAQNREIAALREGLNVAKAGLKDIQTILQRPVELPVVKAPKATKGLDGKKAK